MTTTITLSANEYQALLAEQQRLASQLRLVTVERDLLKGGSRYFAPARFGHPSPSEQQNGRDG